MSKRYSNIEEYGDYRKKHNAVKKPCVDTETPVRVNTSLLEAYLKQFRDYCTVRQNGSIENKLETGLQFKPDETALLNPMIAERIIRNKPIKVYVCGSLNEIPTIKSFSEQLNSFFVDYFLCLYDFEHFGVKGFVGREEAIKSGNFLPMPKFEVNDIWTSHGSEPDKEYTAYSKINSKSFCDAINDHVVYSIFDADMKHILNSDIVINLGPSGKSAFGEMAFAAGLNYGKDLEHKKLVFYIRGLENHNEYDGIDCMVHFADAVFCNKEEFFSNLARQMCLVYSSSKDKFVAAPKQILSGNL